MVIFVKVSALLLFQIVIIAADRDARKGRIAVDTSSSENSHRRVISSSLLEGNGDDYAPKFDDVTKVKDTVSKNLGLVSDEIVKANKKSVETLQNAVLWKQQASKIPILAHDVNALTQSEIFNPIKEMAPKLSKYERQAMSTLLKGELEDIKKLRTDPEVKGDDVKIPEVEDAKKK
mmetsp:Transcript_47941/g.102646  ORF Transcript_47941/g.102646 Transcript_47941/m.102646 type:complete len:176 (-) Transcript_47941:166-693(-)|eukprot:CAMPEP_0206465948 /NCGR_PEP_ID=MMETSP0324_2-20121206/28152_1 /ASSEMBLY_ACC=CAM_ASM_000836 /TAXON_ID=2866 /ORGANISM="Crypthecodinium cohnii, Strain Seligo" /LENGTH=175 /DNA_ID=CAMNT_0053938941 /DNA_START=81 /DNA_END=608 /DNA_ORIENTATION=-